MRQFKRLLYRHKDRTYAFAYHLLGNREDAEEVTQDVLLRLFDHYRRLETDRIGSWIMRVTRNLCIDRLRMRTARASHESADPNAAAYLLASTADLDPERRMEEDQLGSLILNAIRRLPEPQRSVVLLREVHASSYGEISAALNLPLNTVKVYLYRARRNLREILTQQLDYEHQS